jgi:flavin-dependent dehydrogenase
MVDVLIAGAGVAGCSLAIQLGRAGLNVEVFERGHFPKEKPCGEGLMPGGVAVLDRLGLSDAIGGHLFRGIRYHFGRRIAEGRFAANSGIGQRRKHLDNVLFQSASSTAGVRITTGAAVDGPLVENGVVKGLLVNGIPHRAKLTVAADGVHSRIRHKLGLDIPVRRKRIGACCHFRLAAGNSTPDWVEIFLKRGYELYVTPLPNHEILVAALFEEACGPVDQSLHRWIQSEPYLAQLLEGAAQISEVDCISPLAGRARTGVLPGLVLLGDAAGFLDPITGGGMTQALMTSELLSNCIATQSLHRFEQRRNAMLRDFKVVNSMVLWLADHPNLATSALSVLRAFPSLFSRLIAISSGTNLRPE